MERRRANFDMRSGTDKRKLYHLGLLSKGGVERRCWIKMGMSIGIKEPGLNKEFRPGFFAKRLMPL